MASEVKDVAQETARATEDIAGRVQSIQTDTTGAVEVIGGISAVIAAISDYQSTIAATVEEQTATTSEMSRNVADASTGSGRIATTIAGDASAAGSATEAVTQTLHAIAELTAMAGSLTDEVARLCVG